MGKVNPLEDPKVRAIKKRRIMTRGFFIETAILLIFPYPFYERIFSFDFISVDGKTTEQVYYPLCHFLIVARFARLFFLVRSIFNFSLYTDAYSKKLCQSYGFTSEVRFTFKCLFATNPEKLVVIIFGSTIMILAYVLRIFELPYHKFGVEQSL